MLLLSLHLRGATRSQALVGPHPETDPSTISRHVSLR